MTLTQTCQFVVGQLVAGATVAGVAADRVDAAVLAAVAPGARVRALVEVCTRHRRSLRQYISYMHVVGEGVSLFNGVWQKSTGCRSGGQKFTRDQLQGISYKGSVTRDQLQGISYKGSVTWDQAVISEQAVIIDQAITS